MPARTSIALNFRAEAYDFPDGSVDAGTVMSWLDKAGYAMAATWTRTNVVAAYVGNMRFQHSVPVESTVVVQARLIRTGKKTVHVQTRLLLPEQLDEDGKPTVSTQCVLIYTAVNDAGDPVPVPPWEPTTEGGLARRALAERRGVEHRAGEDALDTAVFPEPEDTSAEIVTLRFVASTKEVPRGGKVPGGTVLRWIDTAADVCAARWVGASVVAVFAGGVRFLREVRSGDLVEIEARLVHTTKRSVYVVIRARTGSRTSRDMHSFAHGVSVMVSTGADGKAREVPAWEATTAEEKVLEEMSVDLVELRNRVVYEWARS